MLDGSLPCVGLFPLLAVKTGLSSYSVKNSFVNSEDYPYVFA